MLRRPHTLFINVSSSRCGHCGQGALPSEQRHVTVAGWGDYPEHYRPIGCGQRFVFLSSEQVGVAGLNEAAKRMRPDLEPDFPEWPSCIT